MFLDNIALIPLYPLATAALMLLLGRKLPKMAVSALCVGSVAVAFVHSLGAVMQLIGSEDRIKQVVLFDWVPAGVFHTSTGGVAELVAEWGMLLDPLSAVMILVVTGVGLIIHIYSIGYMGHEDGYYRFFGYMNLFMFSMLTLVLANNLLLMFVGWEGVGLCSYLLIGFYFLKKSAGDAGKKAFIVNRIGDAGFLLGIFFVLSVLGTIKFTEMNTVLANGTFGTAEMTAIALLLFVGATGKSAQIPLYVWLPDAMEGPTPVSALIHAATMVTAGVYMVVRTNAIFQLAPMAMTVVAVVGAVTAIYAASMGLVQNDIKRVLAYSTISQLGYMFLACGVGAFIGGIFHLMTHAFFKALLFLGSGSVIHALSGEQDMRKMGALWDKIPITAKTFAIGAIAIAGIPPLAGFVSKDEILWKTWQASPLLWVVGFITAGMTAFYMFRLVGMTFFGKSRVTPEAAQHLHESPRSMTVPLMVLALLSVIGGWIGWPAALGGSNRFEHFLEPVIFDPHATAQAASSPASPAALLYGQPAAPPPGAAHHDPVEYVLMLGSVLLAAAGIWLAWHFYVKHPSIPERLAAQWKPVHTLLYRKYYMDEIYDALFVNRSKDLGTTLGAFDRVVIDGLGVDGTAWFTRFTSRVSMWWDTWIVDGLVNLTGLVVRMTSYPVRLIQTGVVANYALVIVLGLLALLGYSLRDLFR